MVRSDKDAYPDECYMCGGRAGTLHHLSYEPEIVVLVCSSCHRDIHSQSYDGSMRHPDLLPEMDRDDWISEKFGCENPPDIQPEEVEWDSEIGEVAR